MLCSVKHMKNSSLHTWAVSQLLSLSVEVKPHCLFTKHPDCLSAGLIGPLQTLCDVVYCNIDFCTLPLKRCNGGCDCTSDRARDVLKVSGKMCAECCRRHVLSNSPRLIKDEECLQQAATQTRQTHLGILASVRCIHNSSVSHVEERNRRWEKQ